MLSIFESEKFRTELQNYQTQINAVTDENLKNLLNNFINKLILEVKKFDKDHEQMIFSKSLRNGSPNRDKIVEIRKTIDRKLEDWKRSNRIK